MTDDLDEKALKLARAAYDRKWADVSGPYPTEYPDAGGGPLGYAIRAYLKATTPAPETHLDARAEALARQIWGYFKGDSTGGTTARQWFDNNKSLGGPAHIIELCRKAMNPSPQPRAMGNET